MNIVEKHILQHRFFYSMPYSQNCEILLSRISSQNYPCKSIIPFVSVIITFARKYISTPLNDSGIVLENSLEVVESDPEADNGFDNTERSKAKYKKTPRPCIFCGKNQTRYKRHVLAKHKTHPIVVPLLDMTPKEVDRYIDKFRREGIRKHNISVLKAGGTSFMKQRVSTNSSNKDVPIMCTGCKGFFPKHIKPDIS